MTKNINKPPISINVQYVKDLSFENPNSPKSLSAQPKQPNINVDVNVYAKPLQDRIYEVCLSIKATAKNEALLLFETEIVYCGVFTIDNDVDEKIMQTLVLIEAPSLLFPFARAILAEITRDGGFMPLVLQPIDFNILYQNRLKANSDTEGSA